MQPPLPEVPKSEPQIGAKPAFLGLNVACATDACIAIFGFLVVVVFAKEDENEWFLPVFQIGATLVYLLYFFLLSRLWSGVNWARWFFICLAPLALWALAEAEETTSIFPQIEQIHNYASSIWSIGFAAWLLLPGVARHFKSQKSDTQTEINAG